MSLNIYTSKSEIPSEIEYIDYNDLFFESIEIQDTPLNREILQKIDKATYNSTETFIGRDQKLGALNKEHLSTGCKTLLNIVSTPEKCFDVSECGQNVLQLLYCIKNGNIYWKIPNIVCFSENKECDITIDNKNFKDFYEFIQYLSDRLEECEDAHTNKI